MTKRFRLFVIVLLLAVSGWFLYPTFSWYFLVPQEKKVLAAKTREEIRDYSVSQGTKKLEELKAAFKKDPQAAFPADLDGVLNVAKRYYDIDKKPQPSSWTIGDVFKAFTSEEDLKVAIEDVYRKEIIALKETKGRIMQLGLDLSGGMSVVLRADLDALAEKKGKASLTAQEKDEAVGRAIEVLKTRIDQFGVSEPLIKREAGGNRIFIELPGENDPERVNAFLKGKGSLTLSIVDDEATAKLNQWVAANPAAVNEKNEVVGVPQDLVPAGLVIRNFYKKDRFGIDQFINRQVVKTDDKYVLDGIHIQSATVSRDQISNQPTVNFVLDSIGADHFYKMTQENVKKTMAVVLDDRIRAGASISEPIAGGQVRVTGFDQKDAQDLSITLRTGALPVQLIVQSSTSIGSSLGQDAINSGLNAILYGFILVAVFMLLYYKGAGINANLALVINMFIVLAVLGVFGMTLTLTAIASFVLTIGIAVDANVIIFERIKEEYWSGKSPATAIDIGFKRAFWTVLDSHVTALIAALFLSFLSKGAIQGFAITLVVGLIASMFTALFVSRLIFDFEIDVLRAKKVSITWRKM